MSVTPARPDPDFMEILAWAKAAAVREGSERLELRHIVLGALKTENGRKVLSGLFRNEAAPAVPVTDGTGAFLEALLAPVSDRAFDLGPDLKQVTDAVWHNHGRLPAGELLREAVQKLRGTEDLSAIFVVAPEVASPDERKRLESVGPLKAALERIDAFRASLQGKILGQDRAIEAVARAMFGEHLRERSREAEKDTANGPRMILTFVGPPGVGKSMLAEALAEVETRSSKKSGLLRLDMSAYSAHQNWEQLVGFSGAYKGATAGVLTGYVKEHPRAVLLVDEIEKAHRNTLNVFLQVLDAGRLSDNLLKEEIDFGGTVIVFTTNLARSLWDAPDRAGFLRESRQLTETILQAMAEEVGAGEGGGRDEGFSPEILSRLAKGSVVLFERLDALAMERIAAATLEKVSRELAASLGIRLEVAEPVLLSLFVLKFGAGGDARKLSTGLRNYLFAMVRTLLEERRAELLEGARPGLSRVGGIRFRLGADSAVPDIVAAPLAAPSRFLVFDDDPWDPGVFEGLGFRQVRDVDGADALLRQRQADVVLLDLHIGAGRAEGRMAEGLEILKWIRTRYPDLPVYLFSESPEKRGLSREAVQHVMQEGGARGIVRKVLPETDEERRLERESLFRQLRELDATHRRQRMMESFQRRLKLLEFETRIPSAEPDADGFLAAELQRVQDLAAASVQDRRQAGTMEVPTDRFEDICGARHAKLRLEEVVAWLRDPTGLSEMGLSIPKGILLTGPPGTGKTSLARAVAGEANVPFIAVTGSAVMDKWAGESERKIREIFASARHLAPAIVFFDEIDSIGGRRGEEGVGSSWRAGLLNELLAQMDGFVKGDRPVFVMAATNRADMLDEALLRPGRFDLQIEVPNPDAEAREQILALYLKKMSVEPDLDLKALAARTSGMSGADLRQVCQEAGFIALRQGRSRIARADLEEAVTAVRMGLSSESVRMGDEEKWSTAVHEAGHAVARHLLIPSSPPVQATILPRGRALGFVESASDHPTFSYDRSRLAAEVQTLLASRAAEELFLGREGASSGCSNDFERATALAVRMVAEWGMDDDVGPVSVDGVRSALGIAPGAPLDAAMAGPVVARASAWLNGQKEAVRALLALNRPVVEALARALVARETINQPELGELLAPARLEAGDSPREEAG